MEDEGGCADGATVSDSQASRGNPAKAPRLGLGEGAVGDEGVAAAVSDPELLQEGQIAHPALQIHIELFEHVRSIENRKKEAFRVLRKGLGYTLSLVVVALPERGVELMDATICSQAPDLLWIVKNNLKKNRLLKRFPEQVEGRTGRL
jgi:hypothetical protein